MRLVLPLPPSKNRLYSNALRWARGKDGNPYSYMGRKRSEQYRVFLEAAGWEVCAQTTVEQREALQQIALKGPLAIRVTVCFPENGRDHDTPNIETALLDALKGPLGIDDERFWRVTVERVQDGPPCVVEIEPIGN